MDNRMKKRAQKQEILISVIAPVYNVEPYIRKCLTSIVQQTYQNLEIILVDDGSTDLSGKICDEFQMSDQRVKVIHKENGGVSSARNCGLTMATGEYIGFVDPDDYIEPVMYEVLLNMCVNYDVEMASVNMDDAIDDEAFSDTDSRKEVLLTEYAYLKGIALDRENIHFPTYSVCNNLYKYTLLKGMEFPETKDHEETVYKIQAICRAKRCAFCDCDMYHYRNRKGSLVRKPIDEQKKNVVTNRLPLLREQLEYLEKYAPYSVNWFRYAHYRDTCPYLYVNKQYNKEIKEALDGWRLSLGEIRDLPIPLTNKIKIVIKMYFGIVLRAHYRRLFKVQDME